MRTRGQSRLTATCVRGANSAIPAELQLLALAGCVEPADRDFRTSDQLVVARTVPKASAPLKHKVYDVIGELTCSTAVRKSSGGSPPSAVMSHYCCSGP